jgi:ATP-binding protein involved in chromosome partitioning
VLGGTRWGELDALLLDLPPGAERTLQLAGLLGARAAFVLVTTPPAVARRVVARSLDALLRSGSRVLGYVENMAGYACASCGTVGPLFPDAGEPLPLRRLGAVPFDPGLAALCDRGWAPGEGAGLPALAAAREVARALRTTLEPDTPEPAGTGDASPEHASPEHASPEHASPEHASPEHASLERASLDAGPEVTS